MINNSGTESKYNLTLPLDGTTGVKGNSDGMECFAEVRIRVEIVDVGATNVVYVQGRIRNSALWHEIITITGEYNDYFDISTYDFVRYVVTLRPFQIQATLFGDLNILMLKDLAKRRFLHLRQSRLLKPHLQQDICTR